MDSSSSDSDDDTNMVVLAVCAMLEADEAAAAAQKRRHREEILEDKRGKTKSLSTAYAMKASHPRKGRTTYGNRYSSQRRHQRSHECLKKYD
jgi:hypothetical protein